MDKSNLPHSYQNLPTVDNCLHYAKMYWIQTFSSKFNLCCFFVTLSDAVYATSSVYYFAISYRIGTFHQSCISVYFSCNFGWCWTRIHPIVPRPFLPHRSAQKPPGRLNLRIHLFPPSSIPGPFIQTPPPLHPPRPQQLFPRLEFCCVIRFLLVILSPKLSGQRYLRSSISHKPAICLGSYRDVWYLL